MELDKRSFSELLFIHLLEFSGLFDLIFVDSLIKPLWFRLFLFYTELNLNFFLSALLHSDDYIDEASKI